MLKKIAQKIKKELNQAKKILLITHIDPDGDTIGSMLAFFQILKKLRKNTTMLSHDPIPDIYKFLPGVSKIQTSVLSKDFDLIVALDAGSIRRLGSIAEEIKNKKIINIDHHSDNTRYGKINYIRAVSSTGELIYDLARAFKMELTREIAVCLYVAIMTDTGNFKYENTSAQTFGIAKALIEAGVSPDGTSNAVYENRTWGSIKILAMVLATAKIKCNGKLIYSVITQKMLKQAKARSQDLTGVIDHLRSIKGVEVAMLIKEEKIPGKVKINFRSKNNIDVQKIAKRLGGGGHIRAAGAIVKGKLSFVTQKATKITASYLC